VLYKELLSAIAVALTFLAFWPYIRSIHKGATRPHVFSWVIWGAVTFIVALAQLADGAGVGAWPIALSGLITFYVAFLAYRRRGDTAITRLDWIFLTLALSSLPLWYLTQDPLWAVVVLTSVDLLGFGPTFRKAYHFPFEEQAGFFALAALRNFIVLGALENYTLTTMLFPAAVGGVCVIFIAMLAYRRRLAGASSV
jgi:hypothetical protein